MPCCTETANRCESMRANWAVTGNYMVSWEGVADYIEKQRDDSASSKGDKWKEQFVVRRVCSSLRRQPATQGSALFQNRRKNIAELSALSIEEFALWMEGIENAFRKNRSRSHTKF